MKKRKKKIIILLLCFVLIGAGLGVYRYYESQKSSGRATSINANNEQPAKKDNTNVETVKSQDELKKKQEVQKEQEKQKETVSNTKGSKSEPNKQTTNNDEKVTQDKAVGIVGKYVNSKNQSAKVMFDHMQKRDNVDYYVIRAYEDMNDHIATLAWYYVDVNNGKVFEWDLSEDKLIPLGK